MVDLLTRGWSTNRRALPGDGVAWDTLLGLFGPFVIPMGPILLGIAFGMTIACLVLFANLKRRRLASWIILGSTILCLLSYQLYCIMLVLRSFDEIAFDLCVEDLSGWGCASPSRVKALNNIGLRLYPCWQVISDGIIVYTAGSIYPGKRRIRFVVWFLWMGTLVAGICCIATKPGLTNSTNALWWGFSALSFLTNGTATFLIAARLWAHRRTFGTILGLQACSSHISRGERILLTLVESGAGYLLVQSSYTILEGYIKAKSVMGVVGFKNELSFNFYTNVENLLLGLTALYPGLNFILTKVQVLQEDSSEVINCVTTTQQEQEAPNKRVDTT